MISNDIKMSMKKDAKRHYGKWGTISTAIISLLLAFTIEAQKPSGVIDLGSMLYLWGMLFAVMWPIFFFYMRSNPAKKLYLKNMQKHIMGELANTDDPAVIQKLGVAMSYYGNKMSEVQMKEIKAAAASRSHTHSHSYEYRNH